MAPTALLAGCAALLLPNSAPAASQPAASASRLLAPTASQPAAFASRLLAPGVSLCAAVLLAVAPADAVSGGGKDFSGMGLEGEDFSNKDYTGKEFRGIRGEGIILKGSKLASTSFYKADLSKADLSGADMKGASLEEAGLDGADLTGTVLESAYLTRTIEDALSIKGADFSEAIMPSYTQKALCKRSDAAGTNPTTGVDTRDSLMCP